MQAVITELRLDKVKNNDNLDEIRKIVAKAFWSWLMAHWEDKLTSIKILIFKKTIRVKDLSSLYTLLFGPNPFGTS